MNEENIVDLERILKMHNSSIPVRYNLQTELWWIPKNESATRLLRIEYCPPEFEDDINEEPIAVFENGATVDLRLTKLSSFALVTRL